MAGRVVSISLLVNDQMSRGFARAASSVDQLNAGVGRLNKLSSAGSMLALAGAATALTKAVVPAAAAVAALPAALVAVKVATATAKVGLVGVGDAMSAVAEGDAKKLDAALKKLAPSAREFVRETGRLQKAFKPIQQAVQQRMFEGLAGQLEKAGGNVLPVIKTGMIGVSGALNDMAREALKAASTPLFKGQVGQVFAGTTGIVRTLSGAVGPLIDLVMRLTIAGLPLAKRMAGWAADGIKAAAAFVKTRQTSGALATTLQGAGDRLALMGRIVGDVVSGLRSLTGQSKAAAGTGVSLLTTVEQLTTKFSEWAKSSAGQEKAAEVFRTFSDVLKQVVAVLPLVLGPLGVIASALTSMPEPVRAVVVQMVAWSLIISLVTTRLKLLAIASMAFAAGKAVTGFVGGMLQVSRGAAAGASAATRYGAALRLNAAMGWLVVKSQVAAAAAYVKTAAAAGVSAIKAHVAALKANAAAGWLVVKSQVAAAAAWVRTTAATIASTTATVASTVAQKVAALAAKAWAAAQWLLNAAMAANPIGLIVLAVVALIGIFVLAYKKVGWFRAGVQAAWAGIQAAVKFAWENVIKPAWNAISAFITGVLIPIFKTLWAGVQVAFKLISTAIKWAWTNVIKPIWNSIKTYVMTILIPTIKKLVADGKYWFTVLGLAIRKVWNDNVKPTFDKIKSGISAVKKAFDTGVAGIKKTWETIKGILKKPVAFFVNTVYTGGIKKVWSAVRNVVPGLPDLPEIEKFAHGGVVPGGYKPGRDTVLAAMSPGEGVLRPEATRALGADRLGAINAAAKNGGAARVTRMLGLYPDGGDAAGLGIPGFADGGIIGKVKGALKKPIDWGKAAASKVMEFGVEKFCAGIIDPIISRIPQGDGLWGQVMSGIPKSALEGFKGFIKDVLAPGLGGAGGPGMANALNWAQGQAGKPYVWGGVGPGGFDCSGFMSALVNVIKGKSPHSRLFTTHAFTGAEGPSGFQRDMASGFRVGVTHAGVGHMAGTLMGTAVESSGSAGVRVGGGARGADDGLFSTRYGLRADTGALALKPGWNPPTWNGTGAMEYLETPRRGGGDIYIQLDNHGVLTNKAEQLTWLAENLETLRRQRKLP